VANTAMIHVEKLEAFHKRIMQARGLQKATIATPKEMLVIIQCMLQGVNHTEV
jgi:hypothetical protein